MNETCITRIEGDDHIGVYTSERKFINKLRKLQQEYPDQVKITHENPDGSLCVNLPYNWMPFPKPPTKRKLYRRAEGRNARKNEKGEGE